MNNKEDKRKLEELLTDYLIKNHGLPSRELWPKHKTK